MTAIQKRPACLCGKARPHFGFTTDEKATRCVSCKLEEMTNIIDKKCYCGKARACFGFTTDEKATRCMSCKIDGMKNIKDKNVFVVKHKPPTVIKRTNKQPDVVHVN
uniref:Uncharacterized protein n=1 Tax=Marseillevirus LCMAC201 TaxID=2506605 RepID=A0A481YVI4_9VIRU|nr:MAG: uncharacterized protein LCMAC201_00110 [Marseillevirus LCMAC201]